ncbi:hypothetical protein NFI96_028172 [Prochilodus magdalenae]|nr:hypothetical protein NFI96_028172 [Prochilodus magdalenae]
MCSVGAGDVSYVNRLVSSQTGLAGVTGCRAKYVVAVARPPVRFFSPQVPVVDLFLGQQDQAERLREGADVCVLVYYAPWCAHSISAREHVQQVALRMANQVQFVAVNCWWHQGKCRKQKNLFQYPVIHLYYRRFGPIEYKGPLVAEYLESFIRRVSTPLTYLPTRTALNTFISHHETPDSCLQTPVSRLLSPDSCLQTPDSRLLTPHSRLLTPDSSLLTPDSSLQTPHSRLLTPDSSLQTPDSSLQTPHSRLLTPDSRLLTPDSSLLTPDSSLQTPHSRLQTPDSRLLTPDSSFQTPDSRLLTPDSRLLTPDSSLLTPDSSDMMPAAGSSQGVVGYFEFNSSPQPPGYTTFLTSALHALRRDSQGAVRFGVVTSQEVADGISVREDETVYLHRRFNTSLVFSRAERNFTAEDICNWVYENRESFIHWIQPIRAKSYSLEAELHKGPALLTFLPHNPLAANHQLLSEVADVALRYHSCCLSELQVEGGVSAPHSGSPLPGPHCCQSLLLPGWKPESANANANASVCELCMNRSGPGSTSHPALLRTHCSVMGLEAVLDSYLRSAVVPAPPTCTSVRNTYSPFSHYSACCRTFLPDAQTPAWMEPRCPPVEDAVSGLRCRTNKTLRFYLLDSHLSWPLAQRLGALSNHSTNTFTTIVNLRDETHYVLENAEKDSLEHFILNFSAPYSPLHRHLVGHRDLQPPQTLIQEVTTGSFMDTVMDPERDVLLFYYTGWCGFCTVLNHVLLRLARLFQGNSALTVASYT